MASLAPTAFANRFSRLSALAVGGLVTLATVLGLCILGWHDYRETLDDDLARGELQARMLVDQATRAVDTASVVLTYLSEQIHAGSFQRDHAKTDEMLSQALVALPFIRGLTVLDDKGRVLASSSPAEIGMQVDMRRLGVVPEPGREMLGGFIAGRGLSALAQPDVAGRGAVGFIPLLRGIRIEGAPGLVLVALMNPDFFANAQRQTLGNDGDAAYLLNYKGEVLASSGMTGVEPGQSARQHPVFNQYLPAIEHASYIGRGFAKDRQVVAFRLSRTRPWVMVVEHPYAGSLDRWIESVRWFGVASALAVLFVGFMTWAVHRSLRSRDVANAGLVAARQEVMRSERDLRVLLRSVQELIFRTDSNGAITYVNDRWVAMRGQSVEEALNQQLVELVDPADQAAIRALFSIRTAAGVRTATATMRSSDGASHRFDFAVVPLRAGADIVAFAGSAVDVTERYAAEQALQHQLAFIAHLLEISPLPVATLDNAGHYMTVNRAWEEFMGRSRELVIGRRPASFLHPAEAALHAERDAELWRAGGSLRYEAKVRHHDGSVRDVVVTKVIVQANGPHDSRLLSTMMDVSEFREAERAIRQAKESAEESSRAKSEFIANISHELRTPLQTILGFSELGIVRGRDQPKLHGMFTDIHAAGARMLALVNDLLDVSKIESTVGAITLERADLRGLVQSVMRELSPLLAARHLQLACDMGRRPLIAKVDPVRFQQVVRNVAANAIKFSPMGSTVHVDAHQTDDDQICVSIRDHGVGIPESELEKIFEAFVQSSASKDGSGGTGLGLAICKKILDALGGSITAANMPDGGAVFRIQVPARQHLDRDTVF